MVRNDSNSKDIKVLRFKKENGFYTTKDRSQLMSKIKSKGTKPEIAFRKALFSKGIRYRVNENSLPGKPDISIKKHKLAIFIDGEFWHGYNWEEKKKKSRQIKNFGFQKSKGICKGTSKTRMI